MSLLPHQLELLSPARDADIGIEAINHGADAVYIGGPSFGARAGAGNPIADIERLASHAHRFNARVLVALNTILSDNELEAARTLIWQFWNAGADALIVSNHGGRQLDGALSSIRILPSIVRAVKGQTEIWIDSGIRSGQDVLKALAMGAHGTMIGRSYIYGLGAMGEAGVTKALEVIRKELDITMALCGERDVKELGRQNLLIPKDFLDSYV